ncbi:2-amino-4-hydroxy-6-hydroxymethyldihydropteridine diphosphokinase [Sphingobium indicum]|uniref:2-amino-4-hydroxy-6-hydroxymethyldihydropteridine pyrophosphokinase n=2 Tax=Sphingobium indicum TaxID=332055 RepID=A0A1L5BLN2_SPHIB|nr:2-amino-4-hydroxy-6-hydroxymethyldihydropteridine diphosphokinase [Sphingobium indicum]APL93815.1 2-amino-4-hydroxy-6-hydroxymethyldihydropteridine pyrophosphokinase [Sphingobium indicum B90A]KEY97253.1 2-amino-4-hydroxy-6-hydroxymethyldihydropteridine pyrophosphokinase [Sphingomonas sp. BHC-A]NYI21628.1 2-amino-4-hydroxy-6-hydroxymethyldihydropteridine diphosphokinase [Sphingobium indicum]RYM03592.1 2-amino-4-hydroxy-6-hydroxymethyldihydropteridine diphosphokinase [Sphingobium indicum]
MAKTSTRHVYALALGSNRALSARLDPPRLLAEAIRRIAELGAVLSVAPVMQTPPIGPTRRVFANGALLVESSLPPEEMLSRLQAIERALGRQRFRRWGSRRLDIDIILWSGGRWNSRSLRIPHPAFRGRDFVLAPLHAIAPGWRDPMSGLSIRHLRFRLRKAVSGG